MPIYLYEVSVIAIMTTATGLTCVDYLSPKFNLHTFQDSEYNLNKHDIYNEYNFQHLSTYLTERNSFNSKSMGGTTPKRLNYTQKSCLQELRCNFTKLNLAEKFMQSCGSYAKLSPQLEQDTCGDTTASTTGATDIISRGDNEDSIFTNSCSYDENHQYGTPGYSHKYRNNLHDSDTCDTDDEEVVGYIFDNNKIDLSVSRDFRTLRDITVSSRDFRIIRNEHPLTPNSDVTDDDYSDSEYELAMIASGAFHTNPLNKQNRKRSSDCLQEYDIKRPCIDAEKMHLSLSDTLTPVSHDDKQLFVPIIEVN